MERIVSVFYLAVFLIGYASSMVLPVAKCKLEDTSCMLPAFRTAMPLFIDGIPDLGVDTNDPMVMDDLAFDLSGLQFTLKEGRLRGLRGSIIDRVKWDLKKKRFEVDYRLNATVRGHYTAAGRLLILPISGDGQMKLKLRNVAIYLVLDYKIIDKAADGKTHVKPTKYDFTFEVKDNAHFNLTGLFNGNNELSNTMLTFLNENWQQVVAEFGRPMIDAAAKKLFKSVGAFFESVPIKDVAYV